jgi:hypothetical protein
MDSEEVRFVNLTVNDNLGFLNDSIIQNVLRILIFMYIAKTAVPIPALEKALTTPAGRISALTFALWLGNKTFVQSLIVSAVVVLALQFLASR